MMLSQITFSGTKTLPMSALHFQFRCRLDAYSTIYHLQIWLMQQHPLWHTFLSPAVQLSRSLFLSSALLDYSLPSKVPVGVACTKGSEQKHFLIIIIIVSSV